MLGRMFLILMIMPFLDFFVLIKVHQSLGSVWGSQNAWLFTLGMIALAAVAGLSVGKNQGFRLISQAQNQLRQGTPPSQTVLEGMLLLVGATALVFPGYISDVVGLCLLIPWTRRLVIRGLKSWLESRIQGGTIIVQRSGGMTHADTRIRGRHEGEVIDVEPLER